MSAETLVLSISYALFVLTFIAVLFKALQSPRKSMMDATLLFGDPAAIAVIHPSSLRPDCPWVRSRTCSILPLWPLCRMLWFDWCGTPARRRVECTTQMQHVVGASFLAAMVAVLMLAVLVLTAQAFVINRLAGIAYPLWGPLAS